MSWFKEKLWPWIKENWKWIALVLVGIAGGVVIAGKLRGVRVLKVTSPQPFQVLDKGHVAVMTPGGWKAVTATDLGIDDARKVVAVGRAENGNVPVQVDNPPL